MKFTFKFLEEAWKEGKSGELCSELLTEAVNVFACLPKALLFNENEHSKVLIGILQETSLFLEKVVTRYGKKHIKEIIHMC